jgi:hypothetical protein
MKLLRALTAAVGLFAIAAMAPLASANPTLSLNLNDNAGNTATVTDPGVSGLVTFNGGLGAWIVNITTGIGDIILGPGHIDLNSVNVSNSAGGHMTLTLTESGISFGSGAGFISMLDGIGGTLAAGAGNHIDWLARVDGVTYCSSSSSTTPFSNGGCAFLANVADLSNFTIELQVDIYHTRGSVNSTSFDNELLVPEPGTLLLLGAGLMGLAGIRRKNA